MTVGARGQITLKLEHAEYQLIPSYKNLGAIEARLDVGIREIPEKLDALKKSSEIIEFCHGFVKACGHDVTLEEFTDKLGNTPILSLVECVLIFVTRMIVGEGQDTGKK